jgi:Domain of unknown function (DUF4020)/SIR2-like domain
MWIGRVDFPREVLDAQRDGNLVIFAGAGVSMGAPAKCPSFLKLARYIGDEPVPDKEGSALDRYLGRLHKEGVRVHEQACRILSESLEPNPLHKELLELFPSANKVRLVTTNFDRHFSTAAEIIFPGINTFYAPALPLGNDFEGIVYLHGSINQHPDQLVLTDRDFGKAYLTEGWATNFLKALFSRYTVLFIGYSHEDTVVSYLARGLPPNNSSQRFALVREKDAEKRVQNWVHLGIDIRTYPTMEPDTHSALGESIKGWSERIKMGYLAREQEIQEIVEASPPTDLEEISELKKVEIIERALKDPIDIQFFIRHAKSLDWLHWVNNRNLLKPIFEIGPPLGEIDHPLARWFITKYVLASPQEALSIVYQNSQSLNQSTWYLLCQFLDDSLTQPSAQIQLEPQLFAQWIALLLKAPQPLDQRAKLGNLLTKFRYPEDKKTALQLFDHLTQPGLSQSQGFQSIDFKVTFNDLKDKYFYYNGYYLNESWNKYFSPHLEEFTLALLPILTYRLQQYHQLLLSVRKEKNDLDSSSVYTSIIEPNPRPAYNTYHLLTNATKQAYDNLASNHPGQAIAQVSSWYTSGVSILKRLAIYGVGSNTQMTADQKLDWLLERYLLYDSQSVDEVRFVLKNAYSKASNPTRHNLLVDVEKGPPLEGQEVQEKYWNWKIYDLLVWLNYVFLDCSLTAKKLERVQQENPEFKPEPRNDFHSQPVFVRIPSSRPILTTEELLEIQPEDFLLRLGEVGSEISHYPVSEAVVTSPDWGIQLGDTLHEKNDWASLLWEKLLYAWQQATLNKSQWQRVLTLLISHGEITEVANQIANLLDNSLQKETLPSSMEDMAHQLAVRVWNHCVESEVSLSKNTTNDYHYATAIKHPAGRITLFWLRLIARKRDYLGQEWNGLPADIAACLNEVCLGSSWAAQLSHIILFRNLHFLFGADGNWMRRKVLLLLNWHWRQDVPLRAQQAWHAFLGTRFWDTGTFPDLLANFPDLLPIVEQAFLHTEDLDNVNRRSEFSEVLAIIALHGTDETMNPLHQGWLKRFIKIAKPEDWRHWANHIARYLRKLSTEAVLEVWNRWMHEYWKRRVMGLPRSLDADEYAEMLKWLSYLEPVIQEVLPLIEDGPKPQKMESFWCVFLDVRPKSENMEAWSTLILYLLTHSTLTEFSDFCCNKMDSLITYLKQEPKTTGTLRQVCEELARLGCSNASDLSQSLNLP